MTTEEYFLTPETVLPSELAYGQLRVADAPSVPHQRVVLRLAMTLHAFVSTRELGEVFIAPTDVVLDRHADLVVQPDLLFVAKGQEIIGDRVYGPPDLVVEVLSPHPRVGDLHERVGWFAKYGVRECWLVSLPVRQVAVLTFGPGGVADRTLHAGLSRIESRVLPEVTILPVNLFE
jgi:Uma2 family endonuclease